MITDVFAEQEDVFWIVGAGADRRHAVTTRPGAVYAGQTVTAMCGTAVKIPQPTPSGRVPRSAHVTEWCTDCTERADGAAHRHVTWDF
ncbi:hypothetical protein GCM10027174_41610 [Salinifilum aidingensis]